MSIWRFIEDSQRRQPLPEALRGGVEQARLELGDAAQLERVRAGVERRLSGAGGGGSLPPMGGAAIGWGRGQWLMLVGTSIGVVLAALWFGARPGQASQALPTATGFEVGEAPRPTYLVLGRASQPEPEPELVVAQPDAGAVARAARPPRVLGEPRASSGPAALDPQGELEILRVAQAALRTRPSASLEQVRLHEARYPSGVFAQEREVIRVDALFALQRDGEARDRAREFLAQFGSSTHAPRMRSLLGAP